MNLELVNEMEPTIYRIDSEYISKTFILINLFFCKKCKFKPNSLEKIQFVKNISTLKVYHKFNYKELEKSRAPWKYESC